MDNLTTDIFRAINRDSYVYLIKATSNAFTSGLYEIHNGSVNYSNETVEVFKKFSHSIQEVLRGTGITIVFPDANDLSKPITKTIAHYNPELFNEDLFELIIFQEFGLKPQQEERQQILAQSISKEKIKNTLVYACYENNRARVLELIKNVKKSQLDQKLQYTGTPLGLCAENNDLDCFKLIAEAGADVAKKSLAFTPLELAFKHSSGIVKYIYSNHRDVFEKEVKKQGYYIAADSTDIEMLNLLKGHGESFNNYDPAFPHLHNFADRNNIVGIEFCLSNGVDINMKDKRGRTALDKAKLRDYKEAVAFLKNKGAAE